MLHGVAMKPKIPLEHQASKLALEQYSTVPVQSKQWDLRKLRPVLYRIDQFEQPLLETSENYQF
jgi:hypothetical protein